MRRRSEEITTAVKSSRVIGDEQVTSAYLSCELTALF